MELVIINGLSFALPLFILAIAGIYSERSGVTMLALEGLQGFGAFVGAITVLKVQEIVGPTNPYLIYIAMFAAVLGGAAYSALHALLCVKFKANQVISGVVINILAVALTTFLTSVLTKSFTGTASNKIQLGVSPRFTVPVLSQIPILGAVFKNVYPFEVIILVVAAFAWYIMYKSRFGLRLRACGENPHSLDAAGGDVNKTRVIAVLITGGLSGMGGMAFAYFISANFSPGIYMGYGFLAIAALIFGNWKILPTFAVCLFFGFARSGGDQLALKLELSSSVSDLFMVIPYVLTLLLLVFFSKQNRPPRAAGEVFDKGKR